MLTSWSLVESGLCKGVTVDVLNVGGAVEAADIRGLFDPCSAALPLNSA